MKYKIKDIKVSVNGFYSMTPHEWIIAQKACPMSVYKIL